jgi:hypothetical protein
MNLVLEKAVWWRSALPGVRTFGDTLIGTGLGIDSLSLNSLYSCQAIVYHHIELTNTASTGLSFSKIPFSKILEMVKFGRGRAGVILVILDAIIPDYEPGCYSMI